MCGFVGFLGGDLRTTTDGETLLSNMAKKIVSRGPDDSGSWYDPVNRVGLAHRRLAIVDLTSAGHQPMISASGRYTIAFNGEI